MEGINSNNVDIYHPDIYCPAEEYEGVKYPGAYLGERIINFNGCEGREEGQYGISMRRCSLTGWKEPMYYCTSSIANLNNVIRMSADYTIDNNKYEKYEFAYNTHKGPSINNTFVYNNIHQRGGEDLFDYYNDVITSTADLIYEPVRYCKISYGDHDMFINNHSNMIYALKNSNDKYMYVTCTQEDGKGTTLNIVHEGPSNMFEHQCDGNGWTYSPPIYKKTCDAGTQYGFCKDGAIKNINGNVCQDLIIEDETTNPNTGDDEGTKGGDEGDGKDKKEESGNNWWIWILLIVIVIIVVIVIVVFVMRKNKKSVNGGSN